MNSNREYMEDEITKAMILWEKEYIFRDEQDKLRFVEILQAKKNGTDFIFMHFV